MPVTSWLLSIQGKSETSLRRSGLPLVPYYAPGDLKLADAVEQAVKAARGALLANHGPVIGGKDLDNAVYAVEELEETAKLFLLLSNHKTQFLTNQQVHQLEERFPS
jgi:3-dehydro-4-phosphotetronate decarboxylase